MENYRSGPEHGINVAALAVTEVQINFYVPQERTTSVLSVEPSIVSEELVLRVQQWIMFDSEDLSATIERSNTEICAHHNRYTWSQDRMMELMYCKLHHSNSKKDCPTCHPVLKCTDCAMELQVETRRLSNKRGKALIISKWFSLGAGRDPLDDKWTRHLCNPGENVGESRLVPVGAGGVQSAFEDSCGKKVNSLTEELAALLEGDVFVRKSQRSRWIDRQGHTRFANLWTRT